MVMTAHAAHNTQVLHFEWAAAGYNSATAAVARCDLPHNCTCADTGGCNLKWDAAQQLEYEINTLMRFPIS